MKSQRLKEVEEAMAAHPKGFPLNERGQLIPDNRPMAPPLNYKPQPSMMEIVRQQVLLASREAAAAGMETEEEADDFDVGDEPEIKSPYEIDAESEVPIAVLRARAEAAQADYIEAKRDAGLRMQEDASSPVPAKPPTPPEGAQSAATKPTK